jgi:hypothetical protein
MRSFGEPSKPERRRCLFFDQNHSVCLGLAASLFDAPLTATGTVPTPTSTDFTKDIRVP